MLRVRSLLFLFASLPFLSAAAQQPGEKPPEKCTIEGTVVRVGTNEPLRKARVVLERAEGRGSPAAAAVSDSSGKFVLKDVDPGRYRMTVERNGFVRQQYGQRGAGQPGAILTLEPGRSLRDLIFKMVPSAVITGRVFDEDGEPVPYAHVQALRYRYVEGRRELRPDAGGQTNDLGEYRIFGMAPGRYFLSATIPGWMRRGGPVILSDSREGGGEAAYVPTYYPGTTDATRASAIEVKPGDEVRQVDFTLQPVLGARIHGRVFNSITGGPAQGGEVFLQPRDSGGRWFMQQNRVAVEGTQGEFELRGVAPGSYTLVAVWFDGEKPLAARQAVDVNQGGIEGITLVIAPGVNVQGFLRVEGAAEVDLERIRVALFPRDFTGFFGGQNSGRVKPDGTFTLSNLSEGEYRVSVWGMPEDAYVQSARLGSEDVLEGGTTLTRGKAPDSFEVTVSSSGARMEGMVLNEDSLPVSGARVVAVPSGKRRENSLWYKTAVTDQYGRFALRGVAPGEYLLFAWEEIESGIWQDADFLRPVEKLGVAVEARAGSTHTVELKSIPGAAPPK